MAFAEKDIKLLWGRAAGRCSNPECRILLTENGEGADYLTGENAHVIAKSPNGPRGDGIGGDDSYSNLILLCPTCHRKVDKAPEGTFPTDILFDWKRRHEAWIKSLGQERVFADTQDMLAEAMQKMNENKVIFDTLGPKSEVAKNNPGSNAHWIWKARKSDTIIPNNTWIINSFENNRRLVPNDLLQSYLNFKLHANAYAMTEFGLLDSYPLFPVEFPIKIQECLDGLL